MSKPLEWINKKLEFIYNKIDEILEGFKKHVNSLIESLKEWYDEKMNAIKLGIIKGVQAMLGICIPDDLAKPLAEAIPHPELSIPEFKIELPEMSFEFDASTVVSIPKIPSL